MLLYGPETRVSVDTGKYCTLIGMGNAALAAAVPYPGKVNCNQGTM